MPNPTKLTIDRVRGLVIPEGFEVPQLETDPVSPEPESAWVLKTSTAGVGGGGAMGLLLALTYAGVGGTTKYEFSYRTLDATTKRVELT